MELELLWKLAHQLDKETFFEVHGLLEETTEIKEDNNLLDLLERKRALNFETLEEFSSKIGVTKQGYYQWKFKGYVPDRHVNKVAEFFKDDTKKSNRIEFQKTI